MISPSSFSDSWHSSRGRFAEPPDDSASASFACVSHWQRRTLRRALLASSCGDDELATELDDELTWLAACTLAVEDDAIQVDSPEQEPFDEFDDDIDEELILPGTPSPAFERANPFDALGRKSLSPQPKKRRRLVRPKEKPRQEQLDYPESLPYETESLEEMDRKLEEIVRRLIDCVRAKD